MGGEQSGIKDDVSVVDPGWVLLPLTARGRSRFGGGGKIWSLVLNMLSLRCGVGNVGMQVWSTGKAGWEYKFGIHPCRVDEIILGVRADRGVYVGP